MSRSSRSSTDPGARAGRRRRWLFRVASAVALPLVLLVGIEAALRVGGFGSATAFTVPCESGGEPGYCDNPRFTWRFFPPRISRSPWPFAFPRHKEDGVYRIFLIGGSAVQGDPDPTFGVARLLQLLLEARYPSARFELVNAAVAAINSHVVLPIARDLARRDGDLFVIYVGNNEVVGPYGAGTVFAPLSSSYWTTRASVFVRGTRVGQLLAGPLATLRRERPPEHWRGLEMFLEHEVAADDPRLQVVYGNFRRNLEAIVRAATESGAGVILSTVATNLADCAPFASAPGDLAFRTGRLLSERGDHAAALEQFVRARDLDALRFRADSRINETIRSVADAPGVRLLDAERILGELSPGGAPGADLFVEHVHFSLAGNYALALALLERVEGSLPESIRRTAVAGEPPTEEQCARRLAYTAFDRHRVATALHDRLSRPPFTNQSSHAEDVVRLEEQLATLETPGMLAEAVEQYRRAIAVAPSDPWLRSNHALLLGILGDHEGAEREIRIFLDRLPHDPSARERLGAALAAQSRFDEAVAECEKAIELAPFEPGPRHTRAYSLAELGRFDESIAGYRELLEIDSRSASRILNEIGRIEFHRGRFAAAAEVYEETVRRNESAGRERIPDVHFNRALALARSGRSDEARSALLRAAVEYREELRTGGDSDAIRRALGAVQAELRTLDPDDPEMLGIEP